METTENLLTPDLQVDELGVIHLKETAKWAKFLGIVGMVFSVLLAVAGVFAGFLLSSISKYSSSSETVIGTGFISFFYIVIAAVFFVTSLFLYFFGAKMKNALLFTNQELFNESLLNLKRYYRIIGVITIVYLGFLLLFLLIAVISFSFGKMFR